ncbi:MAG: hypothetical protein AAF456_14605 [Planctomycetota bacterium]
MNNLVFPRLVDIQVVTSTCSKGTLETVPYSGSPIALFCQTYARQRFDYQLGPLFTDGDGAARITAEMFNDAAISFRQGSIMEFADIGSAFPLVGIRHYTPDEIRKLIVARKIAGPFSVADTKLWGTRDDLILNLELCGNHQLKNCMRGAAQQIRDEWTNPDAVVKYEYHASPLPQ